MISTLKASESKLKKLINQLDLIQYIGYMDVCVCTIQCNINIHLHNH